MAFGPEIAMRAVPEQSPLMLKPIEPADIPGGEQLDAETAQYLPDYMSEDIRNLAWFGSASTYYQRLRLSESFLAWGIYAGKSDSSKWVGVIELVRSARAPREASIGMTVIDSAHRNQGIAGRVAPYAGWYGFTRAELDVISSSAHAENMPSLQLLMKAGFVALGRRGNWLEMELYNPAAFSPEEAYAAATAKAATLPEQDELSQAEFEQVLGQVQQQLDMIEQEHPLSSK